MDDASIVEVDTTGLQAPKPGKMALGGAAELLVASRIALLGYQVYRPLADDRGVDLIVDVGHGHHLMVQVKAIRPSSHYVFMRKSTFATEPWVALALVIYGGSLDEEPHVFIIPATEWKDPQPPLVSRDYVGLKSPPEYGVNVRKAWKDELAPWSGTSSHIDLVVQQAHPDR